MSTADYVAKFPRRKRLLDEVTRYWVEEARRPPGALDSSLKKHTTLLNKLKTNLLVAPPDALLKDISGLTLTKYLEEIVAAVVEGASKGKGDPEAAVDIIAQLHFRLTPDFLPLLFPPLLAVLHQGPASSASKDEKDREREEKERLTRQRPVLRVVSELALLGAWPEGAAKGALDVQKVIKQMTTGDPQFANLPLISTFLKHFNRAYLGPPQPEQATKENGDDQPAAHDSGEPSDLPEGVVELMPVGVQRDFREMLVGYFNGASKTLVKGQLKLLDQDKRNHEAYIKSGEIFEDRQHAYEKMTRAVERLTNGVQTLADLLGLAAPVLPTAAGLTKGGLQIVDSGSSFQVRDDGPVPGGIWDDEEEKRFYEELIDLKEQVPSSLLGIKEKEVKAKPEDAETANGDAPPAAESGTADDADAKQQQEALQQAIDAMHLAENDAQQEAPAVGELELSRTASADGPSAAMSPAKAVVDLEDDKSTAVVTEDDGIQSGPAARLTALFAALPEASNREMVDKIALEFAFLNSKAARKRLVKFLGDVPKNRTDLLPHYARLIATLNPYMPDVGAGVIEILDSELRYLQRKKLVKELDSVRLKNVRFYGELAKFKVAQPYTILHVLKVFLDDFKTNIENISNLLETCGRFLLRYEGTAIMAKSMVELMRRKQGNSHLDQRHQIMLENAFYTCNPPERVKKEVIQLPPMHGWIQHLMHNVLIKRTFDKVLKYLRKLHWEDADTYEYLLKTFTEIWAIKFGNIGLAAGLVHDLQRYHPDFGVAVIDQVMEDIRIGMEENMFKFNQRRLASVKYLGELYMYRAVSASVIFDTLWFFISFGYPQGLPVPNRESPIDALNDFFRVRLVCTLLDTCGTCFDRGSLKRKLDSFLVVFQLYVTCKSDIPMDVEFMLNDTLETMRPKSPRLKTFAQAAAAMDELLAAQHEAGDLVDDPESDDEGQQEARGQPEPEPEPVDDEEEEILESPSDQDEADQDADEDVVLIRDPKKDEVDEEADADFDREFAKMMADTTDARRGDSRRAPPPVFDTAIPHIKNREARETAEGKMHFSLLSKKGNRPQMRDLDIPMDSNIAVNLQNYQQQSLAERQQLKRLVLQNEARQEHAEVQTLVDGSRRGGVKWRVAPG